MNYFFTRAAHKAIKERHRKCTACGNVQIVPFYRKNTTVRCKRCKADMPPAKSRL